MVAGNRGGAQGPIGQLLGLTEEILDTERELKRERLINFAGGVAVIMGPILLMTLLVVTVLTVGRVNMTSINCAAIFPIILGLAGTFFSRSTSLIH